jgi:hypothetical protein
MNTANLVEIELPEQYLDAELRIGSELSFAREMMNELTSHTGTACHEKPTELLACVLESLVHYYDASDIAKAWNKSADHTDKLKALTTKEADLQTQLEIANEELEALREDLKAARNALRLLRHACEPSKAKGITETLKLISKVA